MRKAIRMLCIVLFIAGVLSACTSKSVSPKNQIGPKELNQEQQEIVDLLSSDKQEMLLFDYKTEDSFKSMEFWVEIYENGVLTDRPAGISSYVDEVRPMNGQLAILINRNSDLSWTFTVSENGARTSNTSEAAVRIEDETLGRGFGPVNGPVVIESGKEIILYTSIYFSYSMVSYSDMQRFIEEPGLLNGYPYAEIVKCKFE